MNTVTLLIGKSALLAGSYHQSGIAKSPASAPLMLEPNGFTGDEQADRRVHGGPEKAVHHYPREHYPAWRDEIGAHPLLDAPGAFGENISTTGLTEENVAVGDMFRLGGALIQVSQGRQPCWKLNHRFGVSDMARRVQGSGRTGWYYRVLEPGSVAPGDELSLVERPAPDWTIHRLWHVMYVDRMNLDDLSRMASLDVLAEGWKRYARRRLDSGRIEDWRKRLEGTE
ncbi:MOSC domain-containing protein [Paracoccus saliphilus]|uniref:MOSC domain-containing protein n=1 Tax=Paracoccus saliphilus TaxID=405559 RepID=A0AA46A5J2_9RHOB|nr:MOSC domain-containing protein [Paracoccus saliphilus]WCR04203.1 MOSC domain-containing protein [Paracoccus saliphilus]SIS81136.1 MOSC domain-containing protein YiiM [Paracoccus saliphilus]